MPIQIFFVYLYMRKGFKFNRLPLQTILENSDLFQDSAPQNNKYPKISILPLKLTARSAELAKPTPHRPTLKTSSPLFDFAEYVKLFQ